MHPQERDLVISLFDRLAAQPAAPRDPEAEALIGERARLLPNALYALAQTACLQDLALKQAQARISELERQVAAAPAAASSFLGGATANPWGARPTSVPVTQPTYAPAPMPMPQPSYAPQQQGGWGMPAAGGGFLRGVAGTALGVAGGTLLAEGISSLFSGHHGGLGGLGGFGGSALAAEPARVVENVTVNNYYGDQSADSDSSADAGWQDDGSGTDSDSGGSADF
ncbi:MAG: DUF2076 domain-containing protein [Bacteroidales bacterium]